MTSVTSSTAYPAAWKALSASNHTQANQEKDASAKHVILDSGIQVAVSGHAFDNKDNIIRLSGDAGRSLMSLVSKFQANSSEEFADNQIKMQVVASEPIKAPINPRNGPYSVEPGVFGQDPVEPIGYRRLSRFSDTPGLDGSYQVIHDQTAMDRMERMLSAERELKEMYGDDIKVAYDRIKDEIIMLTPDDIAYDSMLTGKEALNNLRLDLTNQIDDLDPVRAREVLDRFG